MDDAAPWRIVAGSLNLGRWSVGDGEMCPDCTPPMVAPATTTANTTTTTPSQSILITQH